MTLADIIGVFGGIAGIISAYVSWQEWRKTNRKIAMLTDAGRVAEILPAWYTSRMMHEQWLFGLHMADGSAIAIKQIFSVSDDKNWMDVELAQQDDVPKGFGEKNTVVCAVSADRAKASVQIAQIVAAVDLWAS